ncbi:hypothetical protein MLD38_031609 [Melastoma candidum]|uniref:Uncharacterized protein n=1 Tax=Melastoma candidum TaxID=119954 RepID=A0ACB9MQU4_9MYRT|nr:hypothetical protein MLD38_031609 [Melastoma candidum]
MEEGGRKGEGQEREGRLQVSEAEGRRRHLRQPEGHLSSAPPRVSVFPHKTRGTELLPIVASLRDIIQLSRVVMKLHDGKEWFAGFEVVPDEKERLYIKDIKLGLRLNMIRKILYKQEASKIEWIIYLWDVTDTQTIVCNQDLQKKWIIQSSTIWKQATVKRSPMFLSLCRKRLS